MRSISDPEALESLIARLNALRPDMPRVWGTLSAGEMLCHLGDATESVMNRGAAEARQMPAASYRRRPFLKWVALRSSVPWPRGQLETSPNVDPHAAGTRPTDFETDRRRAIRGLQEFAAAPADALVRSHGAFGPMSKADWNRWAYRHTDHHLRQFAV